MTITGTQRNNTLPVLPMSNPLKPVPQPQPSNTGSEVKVRQPWQQTVCNGEGFRYHCKSESFEWILLVYICMCKKKFSACNWFCNKHGHRNCHWNLTFPSDSSFL